MTVSTTTITNSYNGNGSTTAFAYTFPINSTSEITVIERSATGTETVKTEGAGSSNYSIADNGSAGGTITMGTAPASGVTLLIRRNTLKTQTSDYVENDPMSSNTIESNFDKLQLQVQEVQEELNRSIKLSRTNTMTSTEFTVGSTDRASKILAFDSSGEISVTQELGTVKGNWGASTTYAIRDIVKDTSTNNIFIALTAHTSSGSQPLTTNTDSAKWSLLVDAASATSSASAASGSASTATTKANEAAASASTASGHKDTATTKASEAASSANAAANSASAAAASADAFDDVYLGSKSSDPSTDNDGDSLAEGMLYFNSTNDVLMVYTGSAWQLAAISSSGVATLTGTETLTNKTLTSPKINENVVLTSNATELNLLDGVSGLVQADFTKLAAIDSTATELNLLNNATVTTAEINYSDLVTLGTTAASKVFTADANNLTKVSGAVLNIEDTLTDGSTIAWNVINSPVAKVQLGGNRTLSAPSGTTPASGQFVSLLIIQDGTGSRSLTFNAVYEFTGDVAPVLTTTASKGDLFVFRYNGSKWLEVGRNLNLTLS